MARSVPVNGIMTVFLRRRRAIIWRKVSPDKDLTTNQTVATLARKSANSSIRAIYLSI